MTNGDRDEDGDGFFPYTRTRHGTLSGYDRHRERNEPICAECRAYRSKYDQIYRGTRAARQRARGRADTLLRQRHPTEYDVIYDAELRRAHRELADEIAARQDADRRARDQRGRTRRS